MKWNEIPKFKEFNLAQPLDFGFIYYVDFIEIEKQQYGLQLNPDFQRGHVWTKQQQINYIEFLLKGGKSGRNFYFNFIEETGEYVCVDGLQRTTAIINFVNGKIKAFGQYFKEFEFPKYGAVFSPLPEFKVTVYRNTLATRKEVLQWYIDLNEGGTPHKKSEIEKVKQMLKLEESL